MQIMRDSTGWRWQGTGDLSWEPEVRLQNCKDKIKEYFERSGLEDVRPRRLGRQTRRPTRKSL